MENLSMDSSLPIQKKKITFIATEQGISTAINSLEKLGYGSKSNFAHSQGISRSTVTKFFQREPIQFDSFQRICQTLDLNWQKIAGVTEEKELEQPQPSLIEYSIAETLGLALQENPDLIKAAITGLVAIIGKVTVASGLKLRGQGGNKLLDGAGNLTQQASDFLIPVAQNYVRNYTERHCMFKVLGMGKPVSLEAVYTQVTFYPEAIQTYQSLDAQETAFRERVSRNDDRRSGIEVANYIQYLMLLGGPGMGKTTFLRKIGLEALKQDKGQYLHSSIPVFLELRKFRWKKLENINLEEKIAEEFEYCGLPEYQAFTQEFLKQGKLLILFDGLDEVPPELLGQMTTAIKNLVDRYPKNRFIISCRIAAYRYFQNLSRFTDVVIADFDNRQIQYFIDSWFKSHNRPEWGKKCWLKLVGNDNQATRELAKTPLLLTLICLLFLKQGQFPFKRATLYDRAVSTLLSEWDASKELVRDQQYKGLDTKCKEVLLAEIAYRNFIVNDLFFQQGEVTNQIEQILQEMLIEEKRINGRSVLRTIETQHGILIQRYEDIYSFSHLTLQEFLTAKHVIDNNLDLTVVVTEHLCDERWREVFLLLGGLRKADDLLLAIERQIRTYINTPKLQQLFVWIEEITDPTPGYIQPLGKRAIVYANAYANVIANANAISNDNDNIIAIANANANANTIAIANANDITYSIAYSNAYTIAIANANTNSIPNDDTNAYFHAQTYTYNYVIDRANSIYISKGYANANDNAIAIANAYSNAYAYDYVHAFTPAYSSTNAIANANTINKFIQYAQWSIEFEIYQELDLKAIINELEKLKSQIPDENQSEQTHHSFARRLIEIWLQGFGLNANMVNLSREEIHSLDNYLYANRLLVECERAAVRRSPEVWNQIEERMFRFI
jgi:predicted NACHT family NTPase